MWWVARLLEGRTARARAATWAAVVVLAVWSCWATGALTLLYQRAYAPFVTTQARAALVGFQVDVHDVVPGGAPSRVLRRDGLPLPEPAKQESLLVLGDCAGLYWSSGRDWHPLEQTPATGRFPVRVRIAPAPPGTLEPLLSATDDRGASVLWLRHVDDHRVRFEYEWTGATSTFPDEGVTPDAEALGRSASAPFALDPGKDVNLTLRFDRAGYVSVRADGEIVLSTFAPVARARAVLGQQATSDHGDASFSGTIRDRPTHTPLCDQLTER